MPGSGCRRRHARDRKISEKRLDFGRGHEPRMFLVMKRIKRADPVEISLFGCG